MKAAFIIAAGVAALLPGSAFAIANPASTFCIKMGGRSVLAALPDGGQVGLCYLPDKRIVEEWTLFRMYDGKLPTGGMPPVRRLPLGG